MGTSEQHKGAQLRMTITFFYGKWCTMYNNNWTTWWQWWVHLQLPGANQLILNNQLQYLQGLNTKKLKYKVQLISELANNENTLTTLTETHLNEKILDSEIQMMNNYIGFRADRTLGLKNGGVITYIKANEAVDAEQPCKIWLICWIPTHTHAKTQYCYY